MDGEALERVYQENLEEKIHLGVEGVQYLDYKVLVQILRETEKQESNTYFP